MPPKKVVRIISPRKLTAEEAAENRRLRELVENDREEIIAEGRKWLAEKRRREAADDISETPERKAGGIAE